MRGIQDAGVIACTKHYILNEQEHFRQVGESVPRGYNITEALSSNLDDKTMHELYLWPFADAVRAGTGSSKHGSRPFRLVETNGLQLCVLTTRSTTRMAAPTPTH